MNSLVDSPYFGKIMLTIVAVIVKLVFGFILKNEKNNQGLLLIAYYVLPITIIVWLNFDSNISNSKLTTTIMCINISLVVFNYLQYKTAQTEKKQDDMLRDDISKLAKAKELNAIQIEKINALTDNQKFIMSEVSKMNDKLMDYYRDKKNH